MGSRPLPDIVAEIDATPPAPRIAHDPYMRHLVQLTISGEFSEPAATASLRRAMFERMGELVTTKEMYDAHWAPSGDQAADRV